MAESTFALFEQSKQSDQVNLSLTESSDPWTIEGGGTGQPGRQPQGKADGVTPAGFFSEMTWWASYDERPMCSQSPDGAVLIRTPVLTN